VGNPSRAQNRWHNARCSGLPALDTAGKAASLLSQIAATEQTTIEKAQVEALAKAAGLNPHIELPELLKLLARQRVIQISASGAVEVLGLTSAATVQYAAEIFEELSPSAEEQAAIALAELTSSSPIAEPRVREFVSDEFAFPSNSTTEFLMTSEKIGFVDAEGRAADKLYFNGNLFRRDNLVKSMRVLDSLSSEDQKKVATLNDELTRKGCLGLGEVELILGVPLFEKLNAAGMYDVNQVSNPSGEFSFITRPSAFHKFNDPLVDDAFDLAKALVAALFYGMTQSSAGRGRIAMIGVLLRKLIRGETVGPATAIGEDYRILETRGVIRVRKAKSYGHMMKLLKRDVGEMALNVLTNGETASINVIDRPLPGKMTDYFGPEKTRSDFRRKQAPLSKHLTEDILQALRTEGGKVLTTVSRSGSKGLDLEEALKSYFWKAGYFAVRAVPFRLDEDELATDIDVWLYERPTALTRRRLIVDARDRKSPKVTERLVWTKGVQVALGVDGAIVATKDRRPIAKKLSKMLGIVILDGNAVTRLINSEQLKNPGQLRSEEFESAVRRVDNSRRSADWWRAVRDIRASMLSGMGVQSMNKGLLASGYFAQQIISAQPQSDQAAVGLRLFYHASALAAISLDYILASEALQSQDERRQSIIGSIRYGNPEGSAGIPIIRAAIGLARKYTDNGASIAKQIEYGFYGEADRIPAEIIADYVARISGSDALFNVAREIERTSTGVPLRSFDELSTEAKALLGVFLDFNGISRERLAEAWRSPSQGQHRANVTTTDSGPLFTDIDSTTTLTGQPIRKAPDKD
jgi:hypothetical protein